MRNLDWTVPGYARVAELVRERTGLVFPEARVRDVEATIRQTMARRGLVEVDELLGLLRHDEQTREAFVADLTIGESYFLRDNAQLELMRTRILPELLAARPADRPVRVWSAGCAEGEEPYTLALLFDELDALDRADIVGTDIARARLEEAQRGIYSAWQLRGMPESVRRGYFRQRGRYFELTPRIRSHVDFRYLNLAEDSFPSLSAGIWGMDLILCRNVLIYFDAPTVTGVAQRLLASLSDGGWLLLGASDPAIAELVECDVVVTDAGLAYRRRGTGGGDERTRSAGVLPERMQPAAAQAEPEVDLPASGPSFDELPDVVPEPVLPQTAVATTNERESTIIEAYARRDFDRVRSLAALAAAEGGLGAAGWTAWVRALANEGRLAEAATTLAHAIERQGTSPELLYLHAILLLQSGSTDAAAAAARRALYLDRGLVVAHLTLAETQRRSGNVDGARRALRNAAALLAGMDATAIVPASDGETAGRLAKLTAMKLRLLEAAGRADG